MYRKIGADGLMQERELRRRQPACGRGFGHKVVVPSGTAVQNARTSFVGDRLNCDGYHLDLTLGRYTAACTWYERLFGEDVRANIYAPAGLAPALARVARESAHAAVATPGRVTDMSHRSPANRLNGRPTVPSDPFRPADCQPEGRVWQYSEFCSNFAAWSLNYKPLIRAAMPCRTDHNRSWHHRDPDIHARRDTRVGQGCAPA